MAFWTGKKVLIAGGAGFIGSHLIEELFRRGSPRVTVADDFRNGSRDRLADLKARVLACDLLDPEAARRACAGQEIVMNLAGHVGGVAFNAAHPATMFRDNFRLSSNILEGARLAGAERVLVVSSATVYASEAPVPTPEAAGRLGLPETSSAGYSWAKRMIEYQAEAYGAEFGLRTAVARPYNCYGPRDHFDPAIAHVLPALLRRVLLGENPIQVWGDGTQTRSFLYVEDLARGLADTAERGVGRGAFNIGTAEEVSIAEVLDLILAETGSKARVLFNPGKPAGQPRRACDTTKARKELGFTARVPLREGLSRTIAWIRSRGTAAVLGRRLRR